MAISAKYLTAKYIERAKARMLQKISVSPAGCWLWIGKKETVRKDNPHEPRYGLVSYGDRARLAHRVAKAIFHNFPVLFDDRTILCCHKCDNSLCVNPEHIFLGTHTDNMRDKKDKGRAKKHRLICPHCKEGL